MKLIGRSVALLLLIATSACDVSANQDDHAGAATGAQPQNSQEAQLAKVKDEARHQLQALRFVVDVSERKLRVLQADRVIAEHDVAVGTQKWPTPTGSWRIHRVDINPEWIPPKDEQWAEDREPKAPGDPENPMGRARLVYRMPNTIHGTDDLASLGKAASHGSIRVANDVVTQLAETLLRAGGAWEGPRWFEQMVADRAQEFQIKLQNPVPIQVQA